MKVAVTGAAGFLGRSVLRRFADDPAVEAVLGLDIAEPEFHHAKCSFRQADVRRADFQTLFEGIDTVVHLAFIVQPPNNMPMSAIDEINIEGSRRVFEGAARAGVRKIIHASSVAAYGAHADNPDLLTEESPLRPNEQWYYSRAKGRVEALLDELQARYPSLIIIRLRPSIFLGPGIANSVGKLFSLPVLLCLDRKTRLDLCDLDDVSEAFRLALGHGRSDAFNLSGGASYNMDELGALSGKRVFRLNRGVALFFLKIARTLGLVGKGEMEWIEVAATNSLCVSAEKAKEKLGWKPRLDAKGALLEFIGAKGTLRP